MAIILRAPERADWNEVMGKQKVFLAGSIEMGRAEDWQAKMEEALSDLDVVIFNPRRHDFDPNQEQSSNNPYIREQIEWELEHLEAANLILFYFSPGTLSPITLYELGKVSGYVYRIEKESVVFCPEGYERKANVDINAQWDDFTTVDSWEAFVQAARDLLTD